MLSADAVRGQAPPATDPVDLLLGRLQTMLEAGDRSRFPSLLAPSIPADDGETFADDLFRPDVRRALVRALDRSPLEDVPPGDGYRLVADLFTETAGQARIVTAAIDVRRPAGGDPESWRIVGVSGVTAVEGLYRLQINASRQFAARNLTISAEDLGLMLREGVVFLVEGDRGVTGLVLLGRGTMQFSPGPETEKDQLRIFSGGETLTTGFETAFVLVNPDEYEDRVDTAALMPTVVNSRDLRRAQEIFSLEGPKSFSLDLDQFSAERWYLLPPTGDFLAEVRTKRHGTLTYLRSGDMVEDITLFDRERRLNIALYSSAQRLAARGLSYDEEALNRYDVLDYNIEATVTPEREFIEGRAQVRLRARFGLSSLSLRLADSLTVSAITSVEFGRLLHIRVRNQDTIVVNLPGVLQRDAELTLIVAYSGQIRSQKVDTEVIQIPGYVPLDAPIIMPEPHFLLSNQSYWYPQSMVSDYATATVRVLLPEGYGCVATGELGSGAEVTLRDLLTLPIDRKAFVFRATDPLRYLALVVSRLVRAAETTVTAKTGDSVRITIEANPRQHARGKALVGTVESIIRFYADVLGDLPYPSATVVLIEDELPGGHSPGYFAMLRTQLPYARLSYRNDPSSFQDYPEFFIAHELAHQWWGQAVGWRNYHEQWISEGFAQYFAALYAQHTRGEDAFAAMLRQFRKWSLDQSDQGPISLGYRLGHIKGQGRVFRALVYNKAAAVLHMLRRLLGDETFFNGLRRFYAEQRFRKTGTEDLRKVLEAESGKRLERFFERWIYGAALPEIRYTKTIADQAVTVRFEQTGELTFDIPVTVTVAYADGRRQNVVVPVTDRVVEHRIVTEGGVRQVQINRDSAAIAEFEES
jgi:hypothetical protein